MKIYFALLRAVNVGGTGKLAMKDLKDICIKAGFCDVQTYIASGNVMFRTDLAEADIKAVLGKSLALHCGRQVGLLVRDLHEMQAILDANPFPDAAANRNVVIFLDAPAGEGVLQTVSGQKNEEIRLGKREIHVRYDDGMGSSKLKIPAAAAGTARNIRTVSKLVELAKGL